MEFSTIWSSYGVDVTIVEMLPHILPLEDEEAASSWQKPSKTRVKTPGWAQGRSRLRPSKQVSGFPYQPRGTTKVLEADQALVAIGFRPNSKGLGLEEAGVKAQ